MEELEVFFCDLCNTSVPESALGDGSAVRHQGKVIGPCCLSALRPHGSERRGPAGTSGDGGSPRSGIFAAAFVILVAVAGGAFWIDFRLGQEVDDIGRSMRDLREVLQRQDQQLAAVEKRLSSTVRPEHVEGLESDLKDLGEALSQGDSRILRSLDDAVLHLRDVREVAKKVEESQVEHSTRLSVLHDEVRGLSRDVAEVKAAPRSMPVTPTIGSGDTIEPASPIDAADMPGDGLPPAIAHNVARLSDADDGTRFEAVDELLQTKDNRIYEYILPLAKDSDPFVRRLVLEGLGDYREPDAVEVLLTALADPEGIVRHTAYMSLRKVTDQNLAFDPEASGDQRTSMQRRWQQWWEKNKADF